MTSQSQQKRLQSNVVAKQGILKHIKYIYIIKYFQTSEKQKYHEAQECANVVQIPEIP